MILDKVPRRTDRHPIHSHHRRRFRARAETTTVQFSDKRPSENVGRCWFSPVPGDCDFAFWGPALPKKGRCGQLYCSPVYPRSTSTGLPLCLLHPLAHEQGPAHSPTTQRPHPSQTDRYATRPPEHHLQHLLHPAPGDWRRLG